MKRIALATLAFGITAGSAIAAPVNLSSWSVEQGPGSQPAGNWALAADNNSVTQTVNSQVSVFYDGAASSQGKALSGSIRVNTSGDDDFVGFVLGMDAGEIDGTASSVDYWLVDWKQGTQSSGGSTAFEGIALTHVTGATTNELDFWGHEPPFFNEVERGTTLGDTGWMDLTEYTFELTFTSSLIEVFVDGALEISYTAAEHGSAFLDGGFGFYNYSQGNVTYAGIEEAILPDPDPDPTPSPVPLPASAWLLGLGLAGLVRMKRARA